MKAKRPININVFQYRFPLPALVSILHRVTGVILFLLIPVFLWLLELTTASFTDFEVVRGYFENPLLKFFIWGGLVAFFYHLFAGLRHLIMDFGYAESLLAVRLGSKFVVALSIITAVIMGVWIW